MGDAGTVRSPTLEDTGLLSKPSTTLGWWSAGLAAVFVVFMAVNAAWLMRLPAITGWVGAIALPVLGIAMVLCALVSGGIGIYAIVRQHERSWLVLILPTLVGAYMVFMLLGEILFPH